MISYQEHLTRIQNLFPAWWQRKNRRPLIYVNTPPSPAFKERCPAPESPRDLFLNASLIAARETARAECSHYAGVAFPFCCPNPPAAGFYGGDPVFTPQTVWFNPTLNRDAEENPYAGLAFSENNPWWQESLKLIAELLPLAAGKFFISTPNLYSPLDLLEELRGATRLCLDLVDRPEEVKLAQECILSGWRRQFTLSWEILQHQGTGSTTSFLPAWAPGTGYTIQCDCCGLLSPDMFAEFVVPEIRAQAQFVDYSLFHLDGPLAAKHADMIIAIPEVHGIQWQKGVNGGKTLDWLPLHRKILEAGKLLFVDCKPEEAEALCAALPPEGLLVATACNTAPEADALVAKLA